MKGPDWCGKDNPDGAGICRNCGHMHGLPLTPKHRDSTMKCTAAGGTCHPVKDPDDLSYGMCETCGHSCSEFEIHGFDSDSEAVARAKPFLGDEDHECVDVGGLAQCIACRRTRLGIASPERPLLTLEKLELVANTLSLAIRLAKNELIQDGREDVSALRVRAENAEAKAKVLESDLVKEREDAKGWKAEVRMYSEAWKRELEHKIPPKTHLIDALVIGTQDLKERARKAEDRLRKGCPGCADHGGTMRHRDDNVTAWQRDDCPKGVMSDRHGATWICGCPLEPCKEPDCVTAPLLARAQRAEDTVHAFGG